MFFLPEMSFNNSFFSLKRSLENPKHTLDIFPPSFWDTIYKKKKKIKLAVFIVLADYSFSTRSWV